MTILMYWFGKQNDDVLKKKEKFTALGINVIMNTDDDHEFLLRNSPYYRKAIKNKKFAFASDVWRVWKSTMVDAIYVDVAAEIISIDKLNEIFDLKSYFVIKEDRSIIWNGIFYLESSSDFIKIALEYYFKFDDFITGPTMFSLINKKLNCSNFTMDREVCSGEKNSLFYYKGTASWSDGNGIDFANKRSTFIVYILNYLNVFHKNIAIIILFPLYIIKGRLKFYKSFLKGEKKFKQILRRR